jgi:hypothetical protein
MLVGGQTPPLRIDDVFRVPTKPATRVLGIRKGSPSARTHSNPSSLFAGPVPRNSEKPKKKRRQKKYPAVENTTSQVRRVRGTRTDDDNGESL